MLGSDILDVALGLVFVYLLMSLIATAAREAAEAVLKSRGRWLEKGLIELFQHQGGQDTLLARFYNYPLIYSLFRRPYHPPEQRTGSTGGKLPSYIPSAHFAHALLGVAESYLKDGTGGQPLSADRLTLAAWAVPNEPVRTVMLQALANARGDVEKTRDFLERWYDGTMDRVAGWYRRESQAYVFFGGLVLCVALNVNTMLIAHALHENRALRESVTTAATKWIADHPAAATPDAKPASGQEEIRIPYNALGALALPIGWGPAMRTAMAAYFQNPGWSGFFLGALGALELAAGWLMTALAITLGAPFWFDVLNTIMVVRSTVKPAEKSPDEPSKDGAPKPPSTPPSTPPGQAIPGSASGAAAGSTPAPLTSPGAALSAADAGADEIAALDPALRPRED